MDWVINFFVGWLEGILQIGGQIIDIIWLIIFHISVVIVGAFYAIQCLMALFIMLIPVFVIIGMILSYKEHRAKVKLKKVI